MPEFPAPKEGIVMRQGRGAEIRRYLRGPDRHLIAVGQTTGAAAPRRCAAASGDG